MDFVLNGARHHLDAARVERVLADVVPEPVREHGVRINGRLYPVKQALALATGLPRADFQSQTARRLLTRLGFDVVGPTSPSPAVGEVDPAPLPGPSVAMGPVGPAVPGREWSWEGNVQARFVNYLTSQGWVITSAADTASKARGVDVLARKQARRLGAEVKGWPSKGYADPRRAHEVKPTQATNQAGHWFAHAVTKALMLLDSHPGFDSLVVLPDYPRYRDLARRTLTGRTAAGVHVVFVAESGDVTSDSWGG